MAQAKGTIRKGVSPAMPLAANRPAGPAASNQIVATATVDRELAARIIGAQTAAFRRLITILEAARDDSAVRQSTVAVGVIELVVELLGDSVTVSTADDTFSPLLKIERQRRSAIGGAAKGHPDRSKWADEVQALKAKHPEWSHKAACEHVAKQHKIKWTKVRDGIRSTRETVKT